MKIILCFVFSLIVGITSIGYASEGNSAQRKHHAHGKSRVHGVKHRHGHRGAHRPGAMQGQ